MNSLIREFLDTLEGVLNPVRLAAEQLFGTDATTDPASGAVLISNRPKIAPEAYACVLHPGIADELIDRYVALHSTRSQFSLPEQYRAILRRLNGAHIFDLSLFGIPVSMAANPPLLNRSVRQPFDLATANSSWSVSYKPEAHQFHFGGGPYSWDENLGYFLNVDGSVEAKRKGGQSFTVWSSMAEFLPEEIRRSDALYGPHEERMAAFREELRQRELAKKKKKRTKEI